MTINHPPENSPQHLKQQRKQKLVFGILVSTLFSLIMNLVFLTIYQQPFEPINWLLQLPITIPAGSIVAALVGITLSKKAPNMAQAKVAFVFSLAMSVLMSLIMVPFALIPRMGVEPLVLIQAVLLGIPVGLLVAYLVIPCCNFIIYRKFSMPTLARRS